MEDNKALQQAKNSGKNTPKRQRVPFGEHRRRLSIPPHMQADKAHVYRWINDTQDRLIRALQAGYEFVNKKDLGNYDVGDPGLHNGNADLNSRVSKRLRDFDVYLMRIPVEFYEEDQQLKKAENDLIDEAIRGGGREKIERAREDFSVKYDG